MMQLLLRSAVLPQSQQPLLTFFSDISRVLGEIHKLVALQDGTTHKEAITDRLGQVESKFDAFEAKVRADLEKLHKSLASHQIWIEQTTPQLHHLSHLIQVQMEEASSELGGSIVPEGSEDCGQG